MRDFSDKARGYLAHIGDSRYVVEKNWPKSPVRSPPHLSHCQKIRPITGSAQQKSCMFGVTHRRVPMILVNIVRGSLCGGPWCKVSMQSVTQSGPLRSITILDSYQVKLIQEAEPCETCFSRRFMCQIRRRTI